nr:MAG TPA: hypothetical protein [Caudoviricetes sp.]
MTIVDTCSHFRFSENFQSQRLTLPSHTYTYLFFFQKR